MKRIQVKEIKGYEGLYQISSEGDVFSATRQGSPGTVLRQSVANTGYRRVCLSKKNIRKAFDVHRLVATAFIPNPKNLPTVNHKNFDKTDNGIENLEWMTFVENLKHAFDNGRYKGVKGSKNHSSKLTEKQVCEIRRRAENETSASLAREFKVSDTAIYDIINKRRWAELICKN